ncbi:hypothetical protein Tco_0381980 [Tanacetum coccineum]
MALPPRDKRHQCLIQTLGYTEEGKSGYKTLAKIYYKKIHQVHVLDFARLSEIDEGDVVLDMTPRAYNDWAPGDDRLSGRSTEKDMLGEKMELKCLSGSFYLHSLFIEAAGRSTGGVARIDPEVPQDPLMDQGGKEDVHLVNTSQAP